MREPIVHEVVADGETTEFWFPATTSNAYWVFAIDRDVVDVNFTLNGGFCVVDFNHHHLTGDGIETTGLALAAGTKLVAVEHPQETQ